MRTVTIAVRRTGSLETAYLAGAECPPGDDSSAFVPGQSFSTLAAPGRYLHEDDVRTYLDTLAKAAECVGAMVGDPGTPLAWLQAALENL